MDDQNGTAGMTLPTLPVPLGQAHATGGRARADAAFSAQMLGAGGARRGLRGGTPVLEAARGAYLQAQWLGGDRRTAAGTPYAHAGVAA